MAATPTRHHRSTIPALLLAILPAILGAAPADAQAVRGRVLIDADTPVAGAMVVLVDDRNERRAGAVTGSDGWFRVPAPEPGRYRLRVERIGYRATDSRPLELSAGEEIHFDLVTEMEPVRLDGVTARGDRRCRVRPSDGVAIHTLWEEARKALNATDWAEGTSAFGYRLMRYERDLDRQSRRVLRETTRAAQGHGDRPFASPSSESLARYGFVQPGQQGRIFYAPDARVLLSDTFLDTHCFRLSGGDRSRPGQVGLEFEPTGDTGRPDVRGTLWIDTATAELSELTYTYTGLERSIPPGVAGGRLFFERTPTGVWIVRRWSIRMPIFGRGGGQEQIVAIREDGGEVTEVFTAGSEHLSPVARAVIDGVVRDSATGGPLEAATVYLSGTQHSAVTDRDGRFRMLDLPEGSYTASFTHPRLAALGGGWSSLPVDTRAGDTTRVELWAASPATIAAAVCPGSSRDNEALVVGVLRSASGAPVGRARLELSFRSYSRVGGNLREAVGDTTVTTDSHGGYRVCGLRRYAMVSVATDRRSSVRVEPATFEVSEVPVLVRDLRLGEPALPGPGEAVPLDPVVATARSEAEEAAERRGSRASILTRREIEPLLARVSTVSHLIRAMNVPGLTVRDDIEIASGPYGIHVRGTCIQSGRVRTGGNSCAMVGVLLDGARMVDPHLQLSHLNPDNIESIEFIPATEAPARYGARGEHGMLVIRTVQGGR